MSTRWEHPDDETKRRQDQVDKLREAARKEGAKDIGPPTGGCLLILTRVLLASLTILGVLILAGCDDALDGTGYGEGEPADITEPEAPGEEPVIVVDKSDCQPGSALSHCQ